MLMKLSSQVLLRQVGLLLDDVGEEVHVRHQVVGVLLLHGVEGRTSREHLERVERADAGEVEGGLDVRLVQVGVAVAK